MTDASARSCYIMTDPLAWSMSDDDRCIGMVLLDDHEWLGMVLLDDKLHWHDPAR